MAGWHKLANQGVEIWLPENFIGGTTLDIDAVTQQLATWGPEFEQMAQSLKRSKTSTVIFAFDTNKGKSGLITNAVISKELVRSNFSMEEYLDSLERRLPSQYDVTRKGTIAFNRYPTGYLLAEIEVPKLGKLKQVMYALNNGGAVWQVIFSTPADEYEERLPTFEQITGTITVPYSVETLNEAGNPIQFLVGLALMLGAGMLGWLNVLLKRRKKTGPKPKAVENIVDM